MAGDERMWQRTYDRKGFIAISALTAFLAACGGDADDTGAGGTTEATAEQLGGTLRYYNWAEIGRAHV